MREPKLPKPGRDGKIPQSWIRLFIEAKYDRYDEMLSIGANSMWCDLMDMGLINVDKIEWDDNEDDEDDADDGNEKGEESLKTTSDGVESAIQQCFQDM